LRQYLSKGQKLKLQSNITRENIAILVHLFYEKAMRDEQIGEYFIIELGDNMANEEWTEHIELLVNFWATIFLDEERYKGDPYGPHFTMVGLRREDFIKWAKIFEHAANKVYVPHIAKLFKEKGDFYAQEFLQKLHLKSDLKELKSTIGWE